MAGKQSPENRNKLGSSGLSGRPKSFSLLGASARTLAIGSPDLTRLDEPLEGSTSGSIAPSAFGFSATEAVACLACQVKVFDSGVYCETLAILPTDTTSSVMSRCDAALEPSALPVCGDSSSIGIDRLEILLICESGICICLPATSTSSPAKDSSMRLWSRLDANRNPFLSSTDVTLLAGNSTTGNSILSISSKPKEIGV